MMEAAVTSETLVNFYQTTQRNIPEDSHLHSSYCSDVYVGWEIDYFLRMAGKTKRKKIKGCPDIALKMVFRT
jgi:hypothetical protein